MAVSTFFRTHLGLGAVGAVLLGLTACGGSGGPDPVPLLPFNSPGSTAQEATIPPSTDAGTTNAFLTRINTFRARAFQNSALPLLQNDVLYTAAMRHAGYLDSVESTNGAGGPSAGNLPLNVDYQSLALEPILPTLPNIELPRSTPIEGVWPAFYTDPDFRRRVLAIVGGRNVLQDGFGSTILYENYWFDNGGPLLDETGALTNFRSVARTQFGTIDYDAADSLWQHPFGRISLMRASSRYIGIASKFNARQENNGTIPPFPLFNGAFGGVSLVLEETYPVIATATSFWPSANEGDVPPWGFDAPHDVTTDYHPYYSGPIIHVTMPTTAPITAVNVSLAAVDGQGSNNTQANNVIDAVGQAQPNGFASVYTANGVIPISPNTVANEFRLYPDGTTTPTLFYGAVGSPGGGVGGGLTLVNKGGNIGILRIDHIGASVGSPIRAGLIHGAPDGWGNPVFLGTTWIEFESAIDAQVVVGDFLTIAGYDNPYTDEAGTDPGPNEVFQAQVVGIDSTRTVVALALPIPGGQDEFTPAELPSMVEVDGLNSTPATGQFTGFQQSGAVGNGVESLRNGEILVIPNDPLIPNQWYRVQINAITAAQGVQFNNTWWFQVRNSAIPLATTP